MRGNRVRKIFETTKRNVLTLSGMSKRKLIFKFFLKTKTIVVELDRFLRDTYKYNHMHKFVQNHSIDQIIRKLS